MAIVYANYENDISYAHGTCVYYPPENKYYIKTPFVQWLINLAPPDTTYWREATITLGKIYANYENDISYGFGTGVYYPPTDKYYINYSGGSIGNLPTDTNFWREATITIGKIYANYEHDLSYFNGTCVYYPPTDKYYIMFGNLGETHLPTDTNFWREATITRFYSPEQAKKYSIALRHLLPPGQYFTGEDLKKLVNAESTELARIDFKIDNDFNIATHDEPIGWKLTDYEQLLTDAGFQNFEVFDHYHLPRVSGDKIGLEMYPADNVYVIVIKYQDTQQALFDDFKPELENHKLSQSRILAIGQPSEAKTVII